MKVLLKKLDTQTGTVVKGNLAVLDGHTSETVVGNQQVTVQVSIVHHG